MRGTWGTLNLIMRGMRPGPPAPRPTKIDSFPNFYFSGRFRLRMNGRDRSLQCVSTEAAGVQGFLHQ